MMEESTRAFIAVELNAGMHSELAALQAALKKSAADVKWVEPDSIHLTLKFLGNIDAKKLKEVEGAMEEAAANHRPFVLGLKGVGAFPKLSFPRVVWVGVEQGKSETENLAKELEGKLQKLGMPAEERPFHPHLTLGRVRSPKNKDRLKSAIEGASFEMSEALNVERIGLFKSQLTPEGPIYTVLFTAKLHSA